MYHRLHLIEVSIYENIVILSELNFAFEVHNPMNLEASPTQAWIKEEGWSYGCRYNRYLKKYERNPMNITTTVGKHQFGKGDRWQNVRWKLEPTGFCPFNEHANHSRKTPTRKCRQVVKCSLDT